MIIDTFGNYWLPDTTQSIYIVGGSGVGKTTFQLSLAEKLMAEGSGLAIIDTHDLAPRGLEVVPKHRFRDVVWLDACEGDLAINLVDYAPGQDVTHILDAFNSIYSLPLESYRLLKFALIAQSYVKNSDISDVIYMLQDTAYMQDVVARCEDELARNYWLYEYIPPPDKSHKSLQDTPRLLADARNPILTAIEDMIGRPSLRKMFCVPKSRVSFDKILERGQIFIASIPKRIGDKNAAMVGALLLSLIRSAAYRRKVLKPFPVIVDEFPTFGNTAVITSMLSELRKYGVPLILAHQHASQDEKVVEAALANCHTKMCWEPSGIVLKEAFRQFDFDGQNEEAIRLRYKNAVAIKEGSYEFVGYPIQPVIEGANQSFNTEKLKAYSKKRYGSRKKPKPTNFVLDFC